MAGEKWEWVNDDLRWTPYSSECSAAIQAAHNAGASFLPLCLTGASQPSHGITFADRRHSQVNLGTRRSRPVRRQSSGSESSAVITWEWWATEIGSWYTYDAAVGAIIESEWIQCCSSRSNNEPNGPAGVIVVINNQAYAVMFQVDAVQHNLATHYSRGVRQRSRIPTVAVPVPPNQTHYALMLARLSQSSAQSAASSSNRTAETPQHGPQQPTHNAEDLLCCTDPPVDRVCPICLSSLYEMKSIKLRKCLHFYHKLCIESWFKTRPTCPECATVYGMILGTQPPGEMRVRHIAFGSDEAGGGGLDGYPNADIIQIMYIFRGGIQSAEHENPGAPYTGTRRIAYLPKTMEGEEVLALLRVAWDRRLLFRIGTSISTGRSNSVVWSGVHHKTSTYGGPINYGYPDEGYFSRVKAELSDLGVK